MNDRISMMKAVGFLMPAIFAASMLSGCATSQTNTASSRSNTGCALPQSNAFTGAVDERLIMDLSARNELSGHTVVAPSVIWLPHSNDLIVSWGDPSAGPSAEPQIIARMHADGTDCHVIGNGFAPLPSPDGKNIAYLSRASGSLQLNAMSVDGSNVIQLTHAKGGLWGWAGNDPSFAWSGDSRTIAYATNKPSLMDNTGYFVGATPPPNDPNIAHVHVFISNAKPKVDPHRGADLYIVNADGTNEKRILDDASNIPAVTWKPGTPAILFSVYNFARGNDYAAIQSVQSDGSHLHTIVHVSGMQQDITPVLAEHNTALLYAFDPVFRLYPIVNDLHLASLSNGKTISLTSDFRTLGESNPAAWDDANASAYFIGLHDSVFARVYRVRPGGQPQVVSTFPEEVESFALSPDGTRLAWIGRDPIDHLRLRVANADGSKARVAMELHPYVNALQTSRVEEFHYRSKDGLRLPALLVYPLHYVPGHRYPLIAQIHGGGWSSRFSLDGTIAPSDGPLEWQFWAAKGYAMVITDYRITGTYGRKVLLDAIRNQDYYERDSDDVLGAVDYAIAHGVADPARLGVFGFSYGGTHTNFMITYTHRFKAAISYEGWGNEFSHDVSVVAKCKPCIYYGNGTQWDNPSGYFRESSVFHVRGVKTATMFVSGDPPAGSEPREDNEFFYAALRDQGVPSELLQYDDEGHGLSKPGDQRDLLRRSVAWFDEHLMH